MGDLGLQWRKGRENQLNAKRAFSRGGLPGWEQTPACLLFSKTDRLYKEIANEMDETGAHYTE